MNIVDLPQSWTHPNAQVLKMEFDFKINILKNMAVQIPPLSARILVFRLEHLGETRIAGTWKI